MNPRTIRQRRAFYRAIHELEASASSEQRAIDVAIGCLFVVAMFASILVVISITNVLP